MTPANPEQTDPAINAAKALNNDHRLIVYCETDGAFLGQTANIIRAEYAPLVDAIVDALAAIEDGRPRHAAAALSSALLRARPVQAETTLELRQFFNE